MQEEKCMALAHYFKRRTLGFIQLLMAAFILSGLLAMSASVVEAEPVTLKFATTIPPANPVVTEVLEPWAKKVNEASKGELNIQVISGPTLANPRNVWERVVDGVADIGFGIHGAVGLPFPKMNVSSLPFVVDDLEKGSVGLWRLYAKGLLADEHKDVKVLALVTTPGSLISSHKPIRSLEDMKGLKVRAANKIVADIISALGAAPISVSAPETYQALQRGVVSACISGWVLVYNFKLYEVVHNHLEGVPLGEPSGFVIMNHQSYEKLSPKAKEAIDKFSGEPFSKEFGAWFKMDAARCRAAVKAMANQNIVTLAPRELERWRKALEPITKSWLDETPGGDKVLETYRASMK
jgi:TRAP-type C4-dicarboxylate transport system substrate-binding protein